MGSQGDAADRRWSSTLASVRHHLPWHDAGRLALVKIRQPEGSTPKYAEAFRDRPEVFPSMESIRPGLPLVIVEGEFDALLLGQELAGLASVVTCGSASNGPSGRILTAALACPRWFAAHDADPAGDKAASLWPARAIRARPPEGKDWTDAHKAGIDLRRWWADRLGMAPESQADEGEEATRLSSSLDVAGDQPPPAEPPEAASNPSWVTPERLAVAARGDELRRHGLAAPLCWLPELRE